MLRFLTILILATLTFFAAATGQTTMAPVKGKEVCQSKDAPNTSKIGMYYQLAMHFRHEDPVKGMDYASQAIRLAQECGDYEGLAKSYIALGINERFLSMDNNTLQHFNKALMIARLHDIKDIETQASNSVARIMILSGNIDSARQYINEALDIAQTTNDIGALSYAYINMGMIEQKLGNLDSAITLLKESYTLRHDSIGITSDYLVPLCHMSEIYDMQNQHDKAKDCLYMALQNDRYTGISSFLSSIWMKLAQIYYHTDMPDSAEYSAKKAAKEALESQSLNKLEDTYKLLDSIYTSTGQWEKAATACKEFSCIADTFYNNILSGNLRIIKHSFSYLQNEESISQSKGDNMKWLYILTAAAIALAIAIPYVIKLSYGNRKIQALNEDINTKLQNKFVDLYITHKLQMDLQPTPDELGDLFQDNFLISMPKEIVSGDFFWNYSTSDHEIIVVADCTGHGIPGAMLTMLGISTLLQIVSSGEIRSEFILEQLRYRIKQLMSTNTLNKMQDGMDMSLMVINRKTMELDFSGAYNCLYFVRDGEMTALPATRCPIGEYIVNKEFTSHKVQLQAGDTIYLMSDGYWSQFGGPDGEKISKSQFLKMLVDIHTKTMQEQEEYLSKYFYNWKGDLEQVDDVTVAGFRV